MISHLEYEHRVYTVCRSIKPDHFNLLISATVKSSLILMHIFISARQLRAIALTNHISVAGLTGDGAEEFWMCGITSLLKYRKACDDWN